MQNPFSRIHGMRGAIDRQTDQQTNILKTVGMCPVIDSKYAQPTQVRDIKACTQMEVAHVSLTAVIRGRPEVPTNRIIM